MSFVEFMSKDMAAEAFKYNANVGVVVGDTALFVPYNVILNYRTKNKQALTVCMLMQDCRTEGDWLGFSNTLCIVNLLKPTMTKDEWLADVKQQLTEGSPQLKAC